MSTCLAAQTRHMPEELAKKIAKREAKIAKQQAKVLAGAPTKTEEQREEAPIRTDAAIEVCETKALRAKVLPSSNPVDAAQAQVRAAQAAAPEMLALITLFPAGAPDFIDPDEDEATLAARQLFDPEVTARGQYLPHAAKAIEKNDPNRWLPASPRLSKSECIQAALRGIAEKGHAYGPPVTRLARVQTAGGQRADRTLQGRLSAVRLAALDEVARQHLEDASVTLPKGAWTPVRMDLYPIA